MKTDHRKVGRTLFVWMFILGFLLVSCSGNNPSEPAVTDVPTAVATATPEEPDTLTICLGEEPQSLYLYGNSTQAMWSVLEAIYDGPIDIQNNTQVPVILDELPSVENGGVQLQSAAVTQGDRVANIQGDVVALEKGVKVFPEGCTSPTCAVEWDGVTELKLVQMSATFNLLPGLLWSDGQPLTAQDSVYSFQLSADPETAVSKINLHRTAEYVAVNDQTVKWTGIPGYLTMRPGNFFWIPQPKHLMESLTADQLNSADITNKTPVGWGAYQIAEWIPGSEIRLTRNPNYFRADEGLPKFDQVVYRFLSALPESDLSPMVNGECDIMDPSTGLEDQIQSVRELELAGDLKSYFGQGPTWEGINFGIKPASYDEVYNPYEDRQDFFGDLRMRQAFAYCTDRDKIIKDVLFSQSQIPPTYLPVSHPLAVEGLPVIAYDADKGSQLLDEVGWKDTDNDSTTPRVARGVEQVFNDTLLSVTFSLTDTTQHREIADIVVKSMQECGIEVTPQFMQVSDLLAAGPDGVLFGRKFDLAELPWSSGNVPSCFLYSSTEIPSEKNSWLGTKYGGANLTGYTNAEYDAACETLLSAGLDQDSLNAANSQTQQMLANDLPMLPLFYHIKAMVSRVDLCGLSMDTSSRSSLNQIEKLELSTSCPTE